MAYPGDLIEIIAEALGVSRATVFQHDRNLVLGGYRRTGGRGRSAIQVIPEDAAHLLIAVAGAPIVKESSSTLKKYCALPGWKDESAIEHGDWSELQPLSTLNQNAGFAVVLTELIRSFAMRKFDDVNVLFPSADKIHDPGFVEFTIGLEGPYPKAFIEFLAHKRFPIDWDRQIKRYYYKPRHLSMKRSVQIINEPDLKQIRIFSGETLRKVAALFRDEPVTEIHK